MYVSIIEYQGRIAIAECPLGLVLVLIGIMLWPARLHSRMYIYYAT